MKTLPHVVEARYVSGYRIALVFNTGVRKTVDFSRWLNGADIAPETLYAE